MTTKQFDNSSNLEWGSYDPAKQELSVGFRNGGTYVYHDVPVGLSAELFGAPSPGTFLNANIKDQYRYTTVDEDGESVLAGAVQVRKAIDQLINMTNQLPQSRTKALVLTKLEEAGLWATKL
jgi:hypothetical protein